ncbi:MAG: hypothetical protein FWD74_06615 [Actinomycetia bacterium]|nr:hypothetical protein [Actinomycetes bacterium]
MSRIPTSYFPRPEPCAHCGDTVLFVEARPDRILGFQLQKAMHTRLEHADPGPGGIIHDPVDAGCRRPVVTAGL